MTFTANQRRRPAGRGVYPGSGVSQGGRVGRGRTIHNGIGGAHAGGRTAFASSKGPGRIAFAMPHGPLSSSKPGMSPAAPVAPPVGPGGQVVPPPAPDFTRFMDADYFDGLREATQQNYGVMNPLRSELGSLQARGIGGKTMYDRLYERAQGDFMYGNRMARDEASHNNLLRSGHFDRVTGQMGQQWADQQADLYSKNGQGRIDEINRMLQQQQQQFDQVKSYLAQAASQRALAGAAEGMY